MVHGIVTRVFPLASASVNEGHLSHAVLEACRASDAKSDNAYGTATKEYSVMATEGIITLGGHGFEKVAMSR